MINFNTILSSYDERGTLLKWLKSLQEALESGSLSTVTTTTSDSAVTFHFTFADGTSVDSPAIPLEAGPQGPQGETGPQGPAATIAIGTVSTLPAGSSATVVNSGTSGAAVFDFGIPEGDTGEAGGITNINGYTGAVTTGDGLAFDNNTGELASYDFNLVDTGSVALNTLTLPTGLSSMAGNILYAFNADHTIGKIYGTPTIKFDTLSASQTFDIDFGVTVPTPDADYSIFCGTGALDAFIQSGTYVAPPGCNLRIDTNGKLYLRFTGNVARSGKSYILQYPACIYFFKDFGDEPEALNNSLSMRMAELYDFDPIEMPNNTR